MQRGQDNPDRKAAGLCRELDKWWPALWTFARVEGVEPTNNVSERALRPAVLWRKGSCGSDSAAGSRFAERLLTVAATCRQQGRGLLAFLVAASEAALEGTAPLSLLPTGQGAERLLDTDDPAGGWTAPAVRRLPTVRRSLTAWSCARRCTSRAITFRHSYRTAWEAPTVYT